MYNARLTGPAPRVQVDDTALRVQLGGPDAAAAGGGGFLLSKRAGDGALELDAPGALALRAAGEERARLDVAGLHAGVLTADVFTNLVDAWDSTSVVLPPTANALGDAYITLSNLIVRGPALSNGGGATAAGALLDTYTSTSVLNAPTANALRAAYYNLSNLLVLRLRDLNAAATSASNVPAAGSNLLDNDVWILSKPDDAPRFYFASSGASTFAGSTTASPDGCLFRWTWNEYVQDVMRYQTQPDARLEVLGGLAVLGGPVTACNDVVLAGDLRLGDAASPDGAAVLTHAGSNLGLNMPVGAPPLFTLHVNGPVCATEEVLTLSDVNAKTDIEPLDAPLDALRKIQGCTYRLKCDDKGMRRMGVIAQDVLCAAPEAVHEDASGRLSVAYGNLVALVIEGVKALSDEVASLRREVAALRPPPHAYQQHPPFSVAGAGHLHYHNHSHLHAYAGAAAEWQQPGVACGAAGTCGAPPSTRS